MARLRAAKNASNSTAPLSLRTLFAMFMAMPSVREAYTMAEAMKPAFRRKAFAFFGVNENHASSAISGIIELLVGFIVLVFAILIGFLLLPLINDSGAALSGAPNTSAQQRSVIPIVGLVLIIALVIMALAFLFAGFRNIVQEFK